MLRILDNLLDWIYKKKCYFCKSSKEAVKMCSKCYDQMDFLPIRINRSILGKKTYCAGIYSKNLQKLIRGLKYHRQKELAYYLAKFMSEYFVKIPEFENEFEVVPVPIYSTREKKRKYNHMKIVGEEFCRLNKNCILNNSLITRVKDTKPQYKLKRDDRIKNLTNAFSVDKTKFCGRKIIIIDDICTTGATFESMIKGLI